MELTETKQDNLLTIRCDGRLDANWCIYLDDALTKAVRNGEHRIHLDMGRVTYISSAGLRVLLTNYKKLRAIKGEFAVVNPSETVRTVMDMAGLNSVVAQADAPAAPALPLEKGLGDTSERASYELFATSTPKAEMKISLIGAQTDVRHDAMVPSGKLSFGPDSWAIGIGAIGHAVEECQARFGEFLAVDGTAAFNPSDTSARPDFMVSEGSLRPEGFLLSGLSGHGGFSLLARFEAVGDTRSIGLCELFEDALRWSEAPAAAIVAITETAGLVGAALQRPPTRQESADRFGFPQIRDWLSYTSERAHRDTTSLIVGLVARQGTPFQPLLRPIGRDLVGHFHAACFPYRPLQKGRIELKDTLQSLFESHNLQDVLHLITDLRPVQGVGESEFLRGAVWIAPAHHQP